MKNAADKIRKLEAHAKSARKIGNAAEAETFQTKANELKAKEPARKERHRLYHAHVGRLDNDGYSFEFIMTATDPEAIKEALEEFSLRLRAVADEYRKTGNGSVRRRA